MIFFKALRHTPVLRRAVRWSSSLPHCISCGIQLQFEDPKKPGYLSRSVLSATPKKFIKQSDLVFNEILQGLSQEERALLENRVGGLEDVEGLEEYEKQEAAQAVQAAKAAQIEAAEHEVLENEQQQQQKQEIVDQHEKLIHSETLDQPENQAQLENQSQYQDHPKPLNCYRCHRLLYQNEPFTHLPLSFEKVFQKAQTSNSYIYHIISAPDFPHTLNLEVLRCTPSEKLKLIINKCDLITDHVSVATSQAKTYYLEMINGILINNNIPVQLQESNVILASADKSWSIKALYDSLPKKAFMVGEENVGKSSLIRGLLKYDFEHNSKANSFNKYLTKKNDYAIKGPGASIYPGTTQDILTYKLSGGVEVNDLPGYASSRALYSLLRDSWIKHLYKVESQRQQKYESRAAFNSNRKYTRYLSIVDRDCYTLGGIFFVVGPANSISQIRTNRREKGKVFGSLEKAIDSCSKQPKALDPFLGITEEAGEKLTKEDGLQRYVIPPFFGSIDVVVKGLGYITITPTKQLAITKKGESNTETIKQFVTSSVKTNLYEIYAPPDTEICIRESIDSFLVKKQTVYKGRKKQKKTVDVKQVATDSKLISKLYKVPKDVENVNDWFYNTQLIGAQLSVIRTGEVSKESLRRALESFWSGSW